MENVANARECTCSPEHWRAQRFQPVVSHQDTCPARCEGCPLCGTSTFGVTMVLRDGQPVHETCAAQADDAKRAHAIVSERAAVVGRFLTRARHTVLELEATAGLSADDVNALSAAKGFLERAELALGGRFS